MERSYGTDETKPTKRNLQMARWKLTEPHYLNVPSSRWEHTAVDSRTGKPTRKMYKVPMHLDPRVADDWNHKYPGNEMDGEIHVCWEGKDSPGKWGVEA